MDKILTARERIIKFKGKFKKKRKGKEGQCCMKGQFQFYYTRYKET